MRKVFSLFFIAILLASLPPMALAADALYRMLHADEIESFKADQDAVIVGQLIERMDHNFKVKVITVISGSVKSNEIILHEFAYGFTDAAVKPQTKDFFVASIKKTGNYYKNAWGIFKASSGDYKTLNILSTKANGDAAAIEWYIRSGGSEKDFFFKESAAFVRRPNGEVIQIFPKDTAAAQAPVLNEATKNKDTIDTQGVVVILLLTISLAMFLIKRFKWHKP